jgi:type IV pilus assembly protein PilA
MWHKQHQRSKDEGGFTLIELLVVILIIGILAAVAIPAFLNQKGKADDAAAKSQARTAQTAMETFSSDHNGSYVGGTEAELKAIEPTLADTSSATFTVVGVPSANGYEVKSVSKASEDSFTIKNAAGTITRTCVAKSASNKGGCPSGTW